MLKKILLVPNFLFRPRQAYAEVQQSPELDISLLVLIIAATVGTLDTWVGHDLNSSPFMIALLIIGAIIGTILGAVLYSHLLGWTASLFKKGDDSNKIRMAIPYCFLPVILGKLIAFFAHNDSLDLVIKIAGAIWFYAIAAVLISEIKGMSIVKSILTLLISSLVLLIPTGIIYVIMNR